MKSFGRNGKKTIARHLQGARQVDKTMRSFGLSGNKYPNPIKAIVRWCAHAYIIAQNKALTGLGSYFRFSQMISSLYPLARHPGGAGQWFYLSTIIFFDYRIVSFSVPAGRVNLMSSSANEAAGTNRIAATSTGAAIIRAVVLLLGLMVFSHAFVFKTVVKS